jgi:hypothetical protein
MPSALTETSTFDSQVLVIDDGDDLEKANLAPPHQALANRTKYLKDRIEGTGVKRLQYIATTAALKTNASHDDGDVAVVNSVGLYRFSNGIVIDDGLRKIAATAGTAGTWFLVAAGGAAYNVPGGIAGLDAAGKVDVAQQHNAIVGSYGAKMPGNTASGSISASATFPAAYSSFSLSLGALLKDDIVHVDGTANVVVGGVVTVEIYVATSVSPAAGGKTGAMGTARDSATGDPLALAGGRFVVPSNGTYLAFYVVTQAALQSSTYLWQSAAAEGTSLRALVIRP